MAQEHEMLDIQKRRKQPRLWIENLTIFSDTDPVAVLREISFTQGLNIIWSIAQQVDDDEDTSSMLTGHSVGKTLLCRLIRYCLGEHTFGRKDAVEAIRHVFPKGAVGATIHVDGVSWSVVRSIGISDNSYASSELPLSGLAAMPHGEYPYSGFRKSLDEIFVKPLPSPKPPEGKEPYLWDHILAWLTRDQETRYQNFWKWRSQRSGSQTPTFARRKQDALFLIRMVLGIADDRESKRIEKIENLKNTVKEKETRQKELIEESENRIQYAKQALIDLMGPPEKGLDNGNGLFGLTTRVESFKKSTSQELEKLKDKKRLLDNTLIANKAIVRNMERNIKKLVAAVQGIDESLEKPDEKDKERQTLESEWESECTFGNIDFKQCSHYRAYLDELRGKWIALEKIRKEKRAHTSSQNDVQAIEQMILDEAQMREKLNRHYTEIQNLENQIKSVDEKIQQAVMKLKLIEHHNAQRRDAMELKDGEKEGSELSVIINEIQTDRHDLRNMGAALEKAQSDPYHRVMELKKLYDKVLKTVLSDSYAGEILLPPKEDLSFVIRKTAGNLTGEAVESLALILADVTAMLWAVEGNGHHPCFLMHDSPREADLDHHIYGRFLRRIHELSNNLDGHQAPFQYILTTTTDPPQTMQNTETIRLKLKAQPEDRLLFKRFLKKPGIFD